MKEKARIVIVSWPSPEIRTMGVLTSTFRSEDGGKQLASVYIPTAPQTKLGYIRVIEFDQIEVTDWSLKQWQLYQFTFASLSPESLRDNPAE